MKTKTNTSNKCVRMTKRNGIWMSDDTNVRIVFVNDKEYDNIWVAMCGFTVLEKPIMLGAGKETDMLSIVQDAYSNSMGWNMLLRLFDEEDVEMAV